MNALPTPDLSPVPEAMATFPTALEESVHLLSVSPQVLELTRLYGRGPLACSIGDTTWLFRWRYLTEPLTGVELQLSVGGTGVVICLETLTAFGPAADINRAELPAGLRAAYLNGIG